MKLTKLDHELAPIEKLPESIALKYPTFKMLYRASLGNAVGKSAKESMACYDLMSRLQLAGDEMDINADDFAMLKEKVERNTAQWVTFFHAQVLKQLQNDEGATNGKH